ncbi:MAG: 3'-5' exonuclease [Deltaproteobacteria bacterium]|nr:MAG: 3'-5' exonuclease [Deltaproteobacteria bacterium]
MPPTLIDPTRPLRGAPILVFDFETTGVVPGKRNPVQLAVAVGRLGEGVERRWDTLIRPPGPIPPEASAVHGITDDDVADAPTFAEVVDRLLADLNGRLPCAYNLPFDHAVLAESLELMGRGDDAPPLYGLDPLVWAKVVDKFERGKKLEDVARRRGIRFDAHDARADVDVTAKIMGTLLRELATGRHIMQPGLDRVDHFWDWQRRTALELELEFRDYRRRNGQPDPTLTWHQGLGVRPD